MKSIEKLREYAPNHPELYAVCNAAADEIEAEIADRYMELPLDADGVPIRIGDDVTWLNGTPSSKFTIDTFAFDMEHGEWDVKDSNFLNILPAHRCRHVKPRTLEDALREYAHEMNLTYETGEIGGEERAEALDDLTAKYAAELRSMGVGE